MALREIEQNRCGDSGWNGLEIASFLRIAERELSDSAPRHKLR